MSNWNNAFWLLFLVMGALVIAGSIMNVLYLDIMFGIFVIAIGLLKISEELSRDELESRHDGFKDSIRYLTHMVDNGIQITNRVREKHEHRLLKMDTKRAELEKIIDDNYDSLAKKIVQVENKLSLVSKALIQVNRKSEGYSKDLKTDAKELKRLGKRAEDLSKRIKLMQAAAKRKALKTAKSKK